MNREFSTQELPCRVYWGSHGCRLPRGHDGQCRCICCECETCVGHAPYYGSDTRFYGEDVKSRQLPKVVT